MRKNDKACHGRQVLLRRLNRNAKDDSIFVPRFDSWMTNNGALLRQWEKIDCRITCQGFARDFKAEIRSNPTPIGCRHVHSRPVLGQQAPITREEFRVRWLAGCRYWQFQLRGCAPRDADSLADQPACVGGKFYRGTVKLCRRRDFLNEQDLIFIAISLNIARIDGF